MKRACLFITLAVLINSCKGLNQYYRLNKSQEVRQKSFKNDTLYIENFLLCNYIRPITLMQNVFEDRFVNEDSIVGMVSNKLASLGLEVNFIKGGSNISNSELCHKEVIKQKHILDIDFESLGVNSVGRRTIVPLISIADLYRFTGYVTSNLIGGDDGFMHYTEFGIIIMILENNEVIYSSHQGYASKRTMANSLEEVRAIPPAYQVREEHIEELVRRAMKRYVKRLER